MKRILAILLVLCLTFGLIGCAKESIRGDITDNAGEEIEFSMGKAEGKNYENKFLGLGCNVPDDWTFSTDAEINELNNLSADAMGDEISEQIKNAEIIYDMNVTSSNGSDNININFENIGILGGAVDAKTRLENTLPTIKEGLANMGCENIVTELTTVKIGGKEFTALNVTSEISGIKLYQRIVCDIKGKYMANITLTALTEDALEEMQSYFYVIK